DRQYGLLRFGSRDLVARDPRLARVSSGHIRHRAIARGVAAAGAVDIAKPRSGARTRRVARPVPGPWRADIVLLEREEVRQPIRRQLLVLHPAHRRPLDRPHDVRLDREAVLVARRIEVETERVLQRDVIEVVARALEELDAGDDAASVDVEQEPRLRP